MIQKQKKRDAGMKYVCGELQQVLDFLEQLLGCSTNTEAQEIAADILMNATLKEIYQGEQLRKKHLEDVDPEDVEDLDFSLWGGTSPPI